jgi:hypothetical protein
VLAAVLVCVLTLSAPGQQPTTLPAGIASSVTLSAGQREQLGAYIEAQYGTMESGSIAQQRGARDMLLAMFDGPSVSTAFRQAAGEVLAPRLTASIEGDNRWARFAALRVAARLASEDSARLFADVLDPQGAVDESDMLMALGQLRVMFIEADASGRAISERSLRDLASLVSGALIEEDNTDIALLQARALRALAQGTAGDLASVRREAAGTLANAVAARLQAANKMAIGDRAEDLDALLIPLETLDGVRAQLVQSRGGAELEPAVAQAYGQLAGQSLGFVTRNYEGVPPEADAAKRYLQRMAVRATEIATLLVADHNAHHGNNVVAGDGMPAGQDVGKWLATPDMRSYRLAVAHILQALQQAYGFSEGWVKSE